MTCLIPCSLSKWEWKVTHPEGESTCPKQIDSTFCSPEYSIHANSPWMISFGRLLPFKDWRKESMWTMGVLNTVCQYHFFWSEFSRYIPGSELFRFEIWIVEVLVFKTLTCTFNTFFEGLPDFGIFRLTSLIKCSHNLRNWNYQKLSCQLFYTVMSIKCNFLYKLSNQNLVSLDSK